MSRRKALTFILIIFLSTIVSFQFFGFPINIISGSVDKNFELDSSIEIDIVLVDYDENSNLITSIQQYLPTSLDINYINFQYTLRYNFIFPTNTYTNALNAYVDSISNSMVETATLNMTALEQQAITFQTEDIFLPQNGTAIDGLAIEQWLWSQSEEIKSPTSSYQLYLLNFSRFDTDNQKHWFEIPEVDPGSQLQRTWWRLEWDVPPDSTSKHVDNYDAKFPYPGYSSQYPIYFLDPYAHQWYLNWTRTWRNVPDDNDHVFYSQLLGDYIDSLVNPSLSELYSSIGDYTGTWLNEIIRNNLFFQPISQPQAPKSITIQLSIFTDETTTQNYPKLDWIINNSIIQEEIGKLLPFSSDIFIESAFYHLENETTVNSILENRRITPFSESNEPFPNYHYYNGFPLFNDLRTTDSLYFNSTSSDINIRGYIFILDNASFQSSSVGWNGGSLFTGLGGGGRLLILNEVDRLYFNRTTTPIRKNSISKVLIHEIGHAVGLSHPFQSEQKKQFGSDFIGEVMGYYPGSFQYSELFVKGYQRYIVDLRLPSLFKTLQESKEKAPSTYLEDGFVLYEELLAAYQSLQFKLVIELIDKLEHWNDNLQSVIEPNPENPIFIQTPDSLVITEGSLTTITWTAIDKSPTNYNIWQNDSLLSTGNWESGVIITQSLENISNGTWIMKIILFDGYGLNTSHQVVVHVLSSSGSTETTVTTTSNYIPAIFILLIASTTVRYRRRLKIK